ncbi:hypothetical protein [Paraburkholderia sediminicola]|uniref:hypothetical protein n=1 Tax=Paraburkholderia sediminicola TaxID=458836 RepID=UPI0038B77753
MACTSSRLAGWTQRQEDEFEEVAHLLVHEKLATPAELTAYKAKLKAIDKRRALASQRL